MKTIRLFVVLLQVLFIGLKLTDQVTWSWWGVMAPFLVWFCVSLLLTGIILVVYRKDLMD